MTNILPTFEQVPYNTLLSRIDTGTQCLHDLTNLLLERKDLEEKNVVHSLKVSRSNLYELEIHNSSTERMLGFYKNFHLYLYKAQVKYHKDLSENVIKELEDLKLARASQISKHRAYVQNSFKDVTAAEEALDKSKKSYAKARDDLHHANEKLAALEIAVQGYQKMLGEKKKESQGKDKFSMGRVFSAFESTPEQDREKQHKKRIVKYNDLIACITQIAEKKRNLMDKISIMDSALNKATIAMQQAEKVRLLAFKKTLKKFCEIENASIKIRSDLIATLEDAVNSQNCDDDICLFVNQSKHVEMTHKFTNALQLMDYFYQHKVGPPYSEEIMKSNDISSVLDHPKSPTKEALSQQNASQIDVTTETRSHLMERSQLSEKMSDEEIDVIENADEKSPGAVVAESDEHNAAQLGGSGSSEEDRLSSNDITTHAQGVESDPSRPAAEGDAPRVSETIPTESNSNISNNLSFEQEVEVQSNRSRTSTTLIHKEAVYADSDPLTILLNTSNDDHSSSLAPFDETANVVTAERRNSHKSKDSVSVPNGHASEHLSAIERYQLKSKAELLQPSDPDELNILQMTSDALLTIFPSHTATAAFTGFRTSDSGEVGEKDLSSLHSHDALCPSDQSIFLTEDQWTHLLKLKSAREMFLQELDERRGRRSLLNKPSYDSITNAMKVILDRCVESDDVKSAMRIANMANTFHMRESTEVVQTGIETVESINDKKDEDVVMAMKNSSSETPQKLSIVTATVDETVALKGLVATSPTVSYSRKYLQSEEKLFQHPIWRQKGFWEAALLEGVIAQMTLSEAVFWDELSRESLREAVIGVHNIVFGQLGSLAFTMHELGLSYEEVEANILTMSRRAQLAEDQEHELMKSIYAIYNSTNIESVNPPVVEASRPSSSSVIVAFSSSSSDTHTLQSVITPANGDLQSPYGFLSTIKMDPKDPVLMNRDSSSHVVELRGIDMNPTATYPTSSSNSIDKMQRTNEETVERKSTNLGISEKTISISTSDEIRSNNNNYSSSPNSSSNYFLEYIKSKGSIRSAVPSNAMNEKPSELSLGKMSKKYNASENNEDDDMFAL